MIKCAQCGSDNAPWHLYCSRCKSKLNLGQITRESFNSGNHAGLLREILQYVLFVIIVCFMLALWPAQSGMVKASGTELGIARDKLAKLQKGVATSPIEFSEKEVNILFNYLLQGVRRQPDDKSAQVSIYTGRVIINQKTLTIYLNYHIGPWIIGPVTIGPFQLTYKVTGRPEKGPDGLNFIARSGAIGHLPLPWLGRNLGITRLRQVFSPFKNARLFLSELEIIEMKEGSITVFGAKN